MRSCLPARLHASSMSAAQAASRLPRGLPALWDGHLVHVCRALRVVNPSPYMIYLQAAGSILVASSPEILCRLDGERKVTNRCPPPPLPPLGTQRRVQQLFNPPAAADRLALWLRRCASSYRGHSAAVRRWRGRPPGAAGGRAVVVGEGGRGGGPRPLAGTRRRGRSEQEDAALAADLLADEKECAEHVMLLDLGRNDVGRVSTAGSVQVPAPGPPPPQPPRGRQSNLT